MKAVAAVGTVGLVAVTLAEAGQPWVMAVLVITVAPVGEAAVVIVDAAAEGTAEMPCGAAVDLPRMARAFLAVAAVVVPESASIVPRARAPRSVLAVAMALLLETAAVAAVIIGIAA